jgi:predicted amidohydrolase YtcJ
MSSLSQLRIANAFDSHVHWQGTGAFQERLQLQLVKSLEDLKKLKIEKHHMSQEWLLGWGWNENHFTSGFKPTRQALDEVFKNTPVVLTRADAHSFWVNTEALKRAGLYYQNAKSEEGGSIQLDAQGWPTGLLIDSATNPIRRLIPKPDRFQIKRYLESALRYFNRAGITHIRDMTCDEEQWHIAVSLAEQGAFSLAVVQNFSIESLEQVDAAIQLALRARKSPPRLLRPGAIKLFFDGSLGSESALLSVPYMSGKSRGLQMIERIALKEIIQRCWSSGLDVAIHTIGDEAAHRVVKMASEIWDLGYDGRLHLEHVELLRPDTIQLMRGKNILCHLQPSHWLSDKVWLDSKIGDLSQYAFRWRELEDNEIPFFFGTDSPIESPSLLNTKIALADAEIAGIPSIKKDWTSYHSFPDVKWTPNTYTELLNDTVSQVIFEGRVVDSGAN